MFAYIHNGYVQYLLADKSYSEYDDDFKILKNEVGFFRKKLKTMYFIVGGVAGLVILQFILNVVGVL